MAALAAASSSPSDEVEVEDEDEDEFKLASTGIRKVVIGPRALDNIVKDVKIIVNNIEAGHCPARVKAAYLFVQDGEFLDRDSVRILINC